MKTHKSGYEIRAEVLRVAAEICQTKYKDHPNLLETETVVKVANELYSFVLDKGVENGSK